MRIPDGEWRKIKDELEPAARERVADYFDLKKTLDIPGPTDASDDAPLAALDALNVIFFEQKFNILDAVVAERIARGEQPVGPISQNDTHYRGRLLERVLNGNCTGASSPDFARFELKLVETSSLHRLEQVMTIGAISPRSSPVTVGTSYLESSFYKKMKKCIIMTYAKSGKQVGFQPNHLFLFEADASDWAASLQEDWESIAKEYVQTIASNKKKRASGYCKSDTAGARRPNGLLGIRSDGVIFTATMFERASRFYPLP
jgi:hypothetical protein